VPPIQPSSVATADVEAVPLATTQSEGDTSSAAGRAGMSEPRVARPESWTPEPCVARVEMRAPRGAPLNSWMPHRRRSKSVKQATKDLRKAWLSDRLGSRSDCQPLYGGRSDRLGSWSDRRPLFSVWSNCLGSRSDHQSLFQMWSDYLDMWSDRQLRPAVESPVEHGVPTVVQA
jgi:hypothetical protein